MALQKEFKTEALGKIVFYALFNLSIIYLLGEILGLNSLKTILAIFVLALIFYNMNLTSVQTKYRWVWINSFIFVLCALIIGSKDNFKELNQLMFIYYSLACLISTHFGYFVYQSLKNEKLLKIIPGDPRY